MGLSRADQPAIRIIPALVLFYLILCAFPVSAQHTAHQPKADFHMSVVRDLAAIGPREFGTPGSAKGAQYIYDQLKSYGIADVRMVQFNNKKQGINVVAVIPGVDSSKQIILGSHHDSVPGSPGAYDDAGGASVMLNVAQHFTSMKPAYTLVFCSFDGEEAGLKGSIEFVKSMSAEEKKRTLFMLCLEMTGWKKGNLTIQTLKYEIGGRNPKAAELSGYGVLTPYPLTSLIVESARLANVSLATGDPYLSLLYQAGVRLTKVRYYGDDASFQLSGIPAVMFSDSSFSSFYPYYHTPKDTPENLSEERLANVSRLILTILHVVKAEDFGKQIDTKAQQEYWIVGPVKLNHGTMRILFLIGQALIVFHLIRNYGRRRLTVLLLCEVLLWMNLFNHYATFAFLIAGIPAFVYLICEWLGVRNVVRNLVIFLPHIAIALFTVAAWRQHFLYGIYITRLDLLFLSLALLLSILRVNRTQITTDSTDFSCHL